MANRASKAILEQAHTRTRARNRAKHTKKKAPRAYQQPHQREGPAARAGLGRGYPSVQEDDNVCQACEDERWSNAQMPIEEHRIGCPFGLYP